MKRKWKKMIRPVGTTYLQNEEDTVSIFYDEIDERVGSIRLHGTLIAILHLKYNEILKGEYDAP